MKSIFCVVLALCLCMPLFALGEGEFPELDQDGFLPEGEFVYENPDEGIWRYASQTLKVEVIRYKEGGQIWYEAEGFSRNGDNFRMIPANADKRMTSSDWPASIAQDNGTVLAINSDFAHLRYQQKKRMGVIIRDGEILSEKTYAKNEGSYPNLDTLALYPDGNMMAYYSDEYTGQEYLDQGAYDVLSFGPMLIKDGMLNVEALDKYGKSTAQRTAIGMVEPGHYFAMTLEGRHDDSKGAGISFLAEKLFNRGCQTAINLDGGQTATMLFMGKQIVTVGKTSSKDASARKTAEILGIGNSPSVPRD